MSSVRGSNEKVIAILCADLHLSLNAPIWRSAEEDWFAAMQRPLDEISNLQQEHNCPVICAGDIFDRWNSSPELINFALYHLPFMHTVPGQHDLPLHNYDDIEKSAYWTLVQAGKIKDIPLNYTYRLNDIILYGFPFGYKAKPIGYKKEDDKNKLNIAVIHEFYWTNNTGYTGADDNNNVSNRTPFKGSNDYDIIVFGDNHKGFHIDGSLQLFNCGSLMRRNSDQIDYKPQVGLLLSTGKVIPHYLDISKDKHLDIQGVLRKEASLDMKEFIQELEKLEDTDLDFHEAMKQYLRTNKVNTQISNIILGAMGL